MSVEAYRGYFAEGFARPDGDYYVEAYGLVRLGNRIVRASDALGRFESREIAQYWGLLWARRIIETLPALELGRQTANPSPPQRSAARSF